MNKWLSYPKYKPALEQEVLVFRQGYDISGTRYWSTYELAVYDINPADRRTKCFFRSLNYRVDKRDGSFNGTWYHTGVTHWMPLPTPPEQISKSRYAELAGYTYDPKRDRYKEIA